MRKGITLLLICLSVVASAKGPSIKEWRGRYQGLMGALNAKNLSAFQAMFADDFVLIEKDGKHTSRADFMRELSGMFSDANHVAAKVTVVKVSSNGNMVDVNFDFRLTLGHKKGGPTMIHEVGVDTWKKVGSKWMFAKTVDKSLDVTQGK